MKLDFYHGHGSPYSWRVWLALEHLKVPYELKVLSFANQETTKPEFVAINPRHQVPTIVDDDVKLWESIPILEYLDERYGVDGPARLYPGTDAERARIRRLVKEIEDYLRAEGVAVVAREFFFKAEGEKPDLKRVSEGRDQIAAELRYLEKEMKGKFLCGDTPTAADFVLAPELGYVNRIQFRKPESALDEVVPVAIRAWHKRVRELPFYDKTFPPHWR
jgi:glutathione S-transferase